MGAAPDYIDDGSSFFPIDPLSINPESLADFMLYERFDLDKGNFRFRCLLKDTADVPKERLIRLLQSWDVVYVHRRQRANYIKYAEDNLEFILKHEDIDEKKKSLTLINLSAEVVKETLSVNFAVAGDIGRVVENIKILITRAVDFISGIESLKGIAELVGHDYETHTHSIKVGWLTATFINANQDLFHVETKSELRDLMIQGAVAGFLHDIGKVKIPRNVINKKGRLDNLEYSLIQAHTAYSASLLFESDLPHSCMQTILYHHENEDGSGYPCGLSRDAIPLIAKICHIADVFDALTSKRSYKEAKTPFEALTIMTGENPNLEILKKFEAEAREIRRSPVTATVRDDYDKKLKRLREREIMEEEARKRVEARVKLRDRGMAHCFDKDLLRRFILTINQSESFDLSGLL
ncbi:HD-GYP domain-containing protein [Desulfospira joergensenii]|uniref:HD-GYP domain-containing protein n=1 Tax=Desulfospira joergensenii TaxID=53329 RepID=UPI0003B48415|nr:HD domain-containing phosphohydrolase [Desulfospira joergensenii]